MSTLQGIDRATDPRRALGSSAVIADSYPLWLRAVETVLESLGVATIGTASEPVDGIELITRLQPDILVTELDFGNDPNEGAAFIRGALDVQPDLKIIVLTMHADSALVAEVMTAGAAALAVKSVQPDDLAAAIRQTFEHSIYLATSVPHRVAAAEVATVTVTTAVEPPTDTVVRRLEPQGDYPKPLTKRESEILQLASDGLPNAEIARRLWVTEQTVKFHLSNIYRKLGVSNRTQASQWVHRRNRPDDPAVSEPA